MGESKSQARFPHLDLDSVLLVTLCGLPAAGKSSLCKSVASPLGVDALREALTPLINARPEIEIRHLSFDDVFWKEADRAGQGGGTQSFDPALWKESRSKVLHAVETELDHRLAPRGVSRSAASSAATVRFGVFLLDDNMYLRSMRYRIHRLARTYRCGHVTLFVDAPISTCLSRNATRSGREKVSEEVIERMATALEMPDPSKYPWERHWVHLRADENAAGSLSPRWTLASPVGLPSDDPSSLPTTPEAKAELSGDLPSALWTRLAAAFAEAVPAELPDPEKTAAVRAAAQLINFTSLAHQADIALRKVITEQLNSHPSGTLSAGEGKAALAARLNGVRKQVLTELKQEGSELHGSVAAVTTADVAGLEAEFAALCV